MRSVDHVTAVPRDRAECSSDVPKHTDTLSDTYKDTDKHTYIHTYIGYIYRVKWGNSGTLRYF